MPRLSLARFLRDYFPYLMPSAILIYIVLESYQIDFRPYYVAGRSVLLGLDPYLNPVGLHPELYVPVNAEDRPWSGFIYPPFASLLFVPFALLPYGTAKVVYSALILLCLWFLFFQILRHRSPQSEAPSIHPVGLVLALCSFPSFASFERGQIDILVCCLTVSAFYLAPLRSSVPLTSPEDLPEKQASDRSHPWFAGLLLAIACGTKIFPFVALIYYAVKRQWQVLLATGSALVVLILAPMAYFGTEPYLNFAKRTFPEILGNIQNPFPVSTYGQTVVNRVVQAIEGNHLRVTHDFVHGYMNPFLRSKPFLALFVGAIAFGVLYFYLRRREPEAQFFSLLNTIHVFNPQTWIMGLVWYFPFFLVSFDRATTLGKWLLVLPILFPPFTNANGMLAYAVTLAFAVPSSRSRLVQAPKEAVAIVDAPD